MRACPAITGAVRRQERSAGRVVGVSVDTPCSPYLPTVTRPPYSGGTKLMNLLSSHLGDHQRQLAPKTSFTTPRPAPTGCGGEVFMRSFDLSPGSLELRLGAPSPSPDWRSTARAGQR